MGHQDLRADVWRALEVRPARSQSVRPIAMKLRAALAIATMLALAAAAYSEEAPSRLASAPDAGSLLPMGALAHATMAVEENVDGKVLEIRLADEKGEPVFEAALKKDDKVIYLRIASPADDVTQIKVSELPPWLVNYTLEAYLRSIERAKVPLTKAILDAEQRANAPAIGAGIMKPLSGTNAVLAYYIEVMKGKKRGLLAVDAETGLPIANPDTLYEPHTPVKLARRLAP